MAQELTVSSPTKGNVRNVAHPPRDCHQQEKIRRRQIRLQLPSLQIRQANRQVPNLPREPELRKLGSF